MSQPNRTLFRRRSIIAIGMLCLAATSLIAAVRASAEPVELRVMSFNVRNSKVDVSEAATENNWADPKFPRRERAIRVIHENRPDVLGVQEARELQIVYLREALPEFGFYGIGRDDGKTGGEYSAIFYRKDRFAQKDAGSFWLSAKPETPGTTFSTVFDAPPRIASWVRLADKRTGRELLILNSHWDNISESAREKSAALIRERLAKLAENLPAIIMGDLNGDEDSSELIELMGANNAAGRKLADSYRELHPERSPNEASFNDWTGTLEGSRIDFILHTDELTPTSAEIIRTNYDGRWPSDHYPVTATLNIERKSD